MNQCLLTTKSVIYDVNLPFVHCLYSHYGSFTCDQLGPCPGCHPAFAHDSWDRHRQSPRKQKDSVQKMLFPLRSSLSHSNQRINDWLEDLGWRRWNICALSWNIPCLSNTWRSEGLVYPNVPSSPNIAFGIWADWNAMCSEESNIPSGVISNISSLWTTISSLLQKLNPWNSYANDSSLRARAERCALSPWPRRLIVVSRGSLW